MKTPERTAAAAVLRFGSARALTRAVDAGMLTETNSHRRWAMS